MKRSASTTRTSANRVGRPAKLTPELIVDAAIALIDEVGAQQLSLRGVAHRLGVTAMALYKHVGNREELELLIASRLSENHRTAWNVNPPSGWRETLHRSAALYQDIFNEHPELAQFPSLLHRADWNFIGVERLLSCLQQEGIGESDAIKVAYLAHLVYRGAMTGLTEQREISRDGAQSPRPDKQDYPTFAQATETAREMDLSMIHTVDFLSDLIELMIRDRSLKA